ALIASIVVTGILVSVGHGALAYNNRLEPWDSMLDWLTPVVNLPMASPSFLRDATGAAVGKAAVWIGSVCTAWLVLRHLERRHTLSNGGVVLSTTIAVAIALMIAAQINWRIAGTSGATPPTAAAELLDQLDQHDWSVAVRYR